MADMLATGLSSLRAFQRALDTTAHNISNVSTAGYSRQTVDFTARQPEAYGQNWIGTGVNTSAVRRVYDQFVSQQVRNSSGSLARLESFASEAERLDDLLGNTANGLGTTLQSFTDAINEVSSTPSSTSARQVVLAQANSLAQRLKSYDTRLREMSEGIDVKVSSEATDINELAKGIARLNGDIAIAVQNTGHPPPDLLDQRDLLIDQLSGKVSVSTVAQGDSSINVFIGNGQPLVLGTTSSQLTTATDPVDPERLRLALQTPAGTVDISRTVAGGSLGGLMDFRREMLDPARNELGRITLAVASQVNAQHREGMDLNGNLGGNIDVNGWRVAISGAPVAGDTFTVRNNAGATGDNRNAFALADAMKAGVLDGGTASVTAAVDRMTGNIGLNTRSAQLNRDAESVINETDVATRDAISGVNLDEEAANMLRFQQAYQASAQIIQVANSLFDTLINAVRR
jgi:flagellar hook-associated protein 1 FlgK